MTVTLLALGLLVLGVIAVPVGRARTGDFFSPPALFLAAWSGTLGLYFLRLLPYPPASTDTLVLVFATMGIVTVAAMAGQRLAPTGPPVHAAFRTSSANMWVTIYSVIGLAGVAWYLWLVVEILGWGAFRDPSSIRLALGEYRIPSGFLFLEFFCIAAPMLASGFWLTGTRLSPTAVVGPLLCVVATWLTTDRTQFFTLVLGIFFMYAFRRSRELSFKTLVLSAAVMGLVLAANFLIIGAMLGKTPTNLGVQMQLPPVASGDEVSATPGTPAEVAPAKGALVGRLERLLTRGSTLYLYSSGSYASLNTLLERPITSTHGLYSAYPIARLLQRLGVVAGPLPPYVPAFVPLNLERKPDIFFNGYTFLFYPLVDFGRGGALVYAALMGLLSGWAYGFARARRSTCLGVLIMGHLSVALVLCVFVNKFNNTASLYIAAATFLPMIVERRYAPAPGGEADVHPR